MKILCFIDHLGSGGAQRQMSTLACGLRARGHAVHMLVYFPEYRFFAAPVEAAGIPVHEVHKGRGFSWTVVRELRRLRTAEGFDAVISFLDSPNVYAELAQLAGRHGTLIVSERNSHLHDRSGASAFARRQLHRLATRVVTNNQTHAEWLATHFPFLRTRLAVIYNGLDLKDFAMPAPAPPGPQALRLLGIGRVTRQKNVPNLIRGLVAFQQMHGWLPEISWAGRNDGGDPEIPRLMEVFPDVRQHWTWLGERSDIPMLLGQHHALIHPAWYEGLPNAVCESLAAGRPVLASNVCDNRQLTGNGERGFLYDPAQPEQIAKSIHTLISLSPAQWAEMTTQCRHFAEEHLSAARLAENYERLLSAAT